SPFMNTTFQLGSPNTPEMGAALTTGGAYSQVAVSGVGSISTLQGAVAAISAFRSSGSISTVAEPPDAKMFLLTLVPSTITMLSGVASHVLEWYQTAINVHLAGLENDGKAADREAAKVEDALVADE